MASFEVSSSWTARVVRHVLLEDGVAYVALICAEDGIDNLPPVQASICALLALGGLSSMALCCSQWRMICAVTRRCFDSWLDAPSPSEAAGVASLKGGRASMASPPMPPAAADCSDASLHHPFTQHPSPIAPAKHNHQMTCTSSEHNHQMTCTSSDLSASVHSLSLSQCPARRVPRHTICVGRRTEKMERS